MLLLLLFFLLTLSASQSEAVVLEVPDDYSSITLALEATAAHDTVWVHPGTYQERLIFPSHDVVLISDYLVTGDTTAIDSTIIDASIFAELDTASVLAFVNGNTRATVVGGFTLTGGHGVLVSPDAALGGCLHLVNSSPTIESCRLTGNQCRAAFVLYSAFGSPAISHCEIYDNCGVLMTMLISGNLWNDDPAIFEWNDVHDNASCDSLLGYVVLSNSLGATSAKLNARFNRFHDYIGESDLGVALGQSRGEIVGNTFERLSTPDAGQIIVNTSFDNPILDNIFRDCSVGAGTCVDLIPQGQINNYRSLVERNWFENITNTTGPACIFMQLPNAEIRDNVFLNCVSWVGAVQFSQPPVTGCEVVFERNSFFYNRAIGSAEWNGSAADFAGFGPPCTFSNNWFEGNEGWTVHFDSTISPPADMSNNYWGDPSGPFHPTENPGGLGDSVPANVHVTPWLTAPPDMNKAIHERLALQPADWSLESAYPNPFNAVINLRLTSAKPQPFEVSAYNILGQRVAQVWQGVVPKDAPTLIHWNGTGDRQESVASGIYYLVVMPRGPGARAPKSMKVVLLR